MGCTRPACFGGLAGYLITFLELLGLVALLAKPLGGLGLVLAWYGLYFGILNRDAAEVASNRMVRSLFGNSVSFLGLLCLVALLAKLLASLGLGLVLA